MTEEAILAGGCFWCSEAIFERLKGVNSVISGYTGGNTPNPTYEEVSTGSTGHAEAIKIEFDPEVISYNILLDVFFATHDPTTLNRQGPDVGTQYRSMILYVNEKQKETAEKYISDLTKDKVFNKPIVTEIKKFTDFYPSESYHRSYYENHRNNPYCVVVINPKLAKLRERFGKLLKPED